MYLRASILALVLGRLPHGQLAGPAYLDYHIRHQEMFPATAVPSLPLESTLLYHRGVLYAKTRCRGQFPMPGELGILYRRVFTQ
jgi:hypothetical protein